ncbi:NADH pyrophosphatase, putative [Gryllus bimaculatus]|nr:NADH pyrophosphatase, putative [Gryllus bimaculatus]
MSGISAWSKIFYGKNGPLEAAMKSCFLIRSLSSSRPCNSYVGDIRLQMTLKRSKSNEHLPYKDGRFLVIDLTKSKVLLSAKPQDRFGRKSLSWIHYEDLNKIGVNIKENAHFLCVTHGEPNFVVNVSKLSEESKNTLESKANAKFIALRSSLFSLDGSIDMPLVSQSHSLLDWKLKHKFCVYCGNALEDGLIDFHKRCTGCKTVHYPTVNPIGISLICNEQCSKILLVRQPIHPPRMFTCVAGFIESGETIEENIKREVAEELGLEAKSIQYVGSQHWSLPGSKLMIGCFATVTDENFSIDSEELEEACWFSPKEIHNALKRVTEKKEKVLDNPEDIWIPPPGAIAHSLIKLWLQKHG